MLFDDRFIGVEKKYHLFDLKLGNDYIWDIFRYYIASRMMYSGMNLKSVTAKSHNRIKKLSAILESLTYVLFGNHSKSFLILATSRYKKEDGINIDKILCDTIEIVKKNAVIIEHADVRKTPYNSYYTFVSLFRFFHKRIKLPQSLFDYIRNAFKSENLAFDASYDDLNKVYNEYLCEYKYYSFLLKRLKPKVVLLNLGNAKSVFKASRDNKVTSILYQHGVITSHMIEFSYPKDIEKEKIYFADYFFTFSKEWGRGFHIPSQIVVAGNTFFSHKGEYEGVGDGAVFVSSIYHSHELIPLAQNFAKANPETHVYYKLHPEEIIHKEKIIEDFGGLKNVDVIGMEISIEDLLPKSMIVVLIRSTVLYTALDQGVKVCIYNRINPEDDENVIYRSDVKIVDTAEEISAFCNTHVRTEAKTSFFDVFNPEVVLDILSKTTEMEVHVN